jgi:TolB protein
LVTVKSELHTNIWAASLGTNEPNEQSISGLSLNNFAGLRGIAWTPDGKIIYSTIEDSFAELWRMDADGTNQQKFAAGNGDHYLPVVSPDNRYIVYTSDKEGISRIWRMNADGSNKIELTNGDKDEHPQFSGDGKWVVFMQTVNGRTTLAKVPTEGGATVSIGQMTAQMPTVSPDGRTIAFLLINETDAKIALMPFESSSPTKIFPTPVEIAGKPYYSTLLRWTADGSAITFIKEENGVSNIWSQPIDGNTPKPLTKFVSEEIFYFDFAKDGSRLALTRGSQTSDVMLISVN